MYKVLVVDDEKEIREGLAEWSWPSLGIEIAGICAHGLEALQFIEDQPVDVVMTDIRMPFMDGIELMNHLHRRYPFVHVVILSGYNEFDYAQKAIRLGAEDYLLKPIHFPVLIGAFRRLVEKLDEQKQSEYRFSVLKRKEKLLAKVLREDFMRRILQSEMAEEDVEQAASEGEMTLDGDCFTVAAYRMDRMLLHRPGVSEREWRLLTFSLDNILNDLWDAREHGYHYVDKETAEFYLLSMRRKPASSFEAVIEQLIKYTGLFKSTFSAGVGYAVNRAAVIHLSARSALHALRESPAATFRPYDQTFILPERTRISRRADPPRPASEEEENGHIVLVQAKRFIEENYQQSITLKEVADHVYVSPGHLSALFKGTKETFLKFLTAIRMRKAIELMTQSNYKVYEIVEMVGYSDPAYFAEVFKRYTGKTPNAYRGKSKQSQGG